jgi:hypothetical protein
MEEINVRQFVEKQNGIMCAEFKELRIVFTGATF